ncbi:MAG: 5-formyltetrahydrofolate cyclo-ligase [Candidatus Sumerlaeia bacterium]|nr:5-formyltetrahydrofolate cyclo-ligase [Candidatus Sumerlaeia bacterium]
MAGKNYPILLGDQKSELRTLFRQRRQSLDAQYRRDANHAITQRLIAWEPVARARRVMTYLSFNDEVETFPLVRHFFAEGRSVVVPYIHQGMHNLIPAEIADLEHDLKRGPMGILEPRPEHLRAVDPRSIDVHVVPGIAFDLSGFRIGFGGGYYDRFLVLRSPHSLIVGAAFDIQIADSVLPHDMWDIPMDYVMTESRLLDCSAARAQMLGQLGLFQHARLG